ncbi:zinc-ribbon domain-containing protein [Paenibacillus psychroresistens]|uniref:Zinc-ribbon domain-containing protein n=1 Tax=Paenibacillus psychroresistens TaxID=1778678 RepID=A0A6B8RGA2_9BACL|nr:SPFH domain-containing protein [Paenibacillus psychroresistens]QGQ94448.1 zinc-ribbon domain-containing protein [Paenibacillus psychroresistens]
MGIFSFLKGQFVEVIEWTEEEDGDSIVHRFPAYDNAIKMGAQLTVRESQAAIFVNEGQIADVFGPGRYELSTQNMPLLTALKSWKFAFNSPFKADVYFVKTTNITDQKWGTTNPVIMRDKEFGVVRARGFGNYSFKIKDPAIFMKEIFGTQKEFNPEQISGLFKTIIVSGLSDLLAESGIPIIELASHYDELSVRASERILHHFETIGLVLTGFIIENISLPEEVEQMIDRKSSMNIAGNLDSYMKYQTAESIREAANNPASGLAGAGAGLGAGMAMGQMMNQMISHPTPEPQVAAATPAPVVPAAAPSGAAPRFCSQCGAALEVNAKFCSGCGTKL